MCVFGYAQEIKEHEKEATYKSARLLYIPIREAIISVCFFEIRLGQVSFVVQDVDSKCCTRI